MSVERNKALVRRYFDALSGKPKPPELVAQFVTDRDLREQIARTEAAFPRYRIGIDDMVAEGDKVAVRTSFEGVHEGEISGLAPAGRRVSTQAMVIYEIEDGKIARHRLISDQLAMMRQLGMLEEQS